MGIEASAQPGEDGAVTLTVRARRLAYGVRVHVPGFAADDDAFSVEPGHDRILQLRGSDGLAFPGGALTALNLDGTVPIGRDLVSGH
jgi:hypothetical protein